MVAPQSKVFHFKQVDSTNSAAFRHAEKGAEPGSVFVADYQTKGRGKWGRNWISPKGKNLLFSILLRPNLKGSEAPMLTQISCRSVASVLKEKLKLKTSFKRPNDILVRGKKICGILVEAKGFNNGRIESAVVGIGLNVNASPDELVPGATSILAETGKKCSRKELLESLLEQLRKDLKA